MQTHADTAIGTDRRMPTQTYTRSHMPTHPDACRHKQMQTQTDTYSIDSHMQTETCLCLHKHTHSYTDRYIQTHIHTHTYIHRQTHIHRQTQADRHRQIHAYTGKLLDRTQTRTSERKCFQSIRTVWDISRYDRARIATCSLLTATVRFKKNYSIDFTKLDPPRVLPWIDH